MSQHSLIIIMRAEVVMTTVIQTVFRPRGLILLLPLCSLINLGQCNNNINKNSKKKFLSPLMRVTMNPIVD